MNAEQWYQDLQRHVQKATDKIDAKEKLRKEIEEHAFRIQYGKELTELPDLEILDFVDTRTVSSVECLCNRVLYKNVFFLDIREDATQFPTQEEVRRHLRVHRQKSSYRRFPGFCSDTVSPGAWKEALALFHYRLFPDYLESTKSSGVIFLIDGHNARARMHTVVAHMRTEKTQLWEKLKGSK